MQFKHLTNLHVYTVLPFSLCFQVWCIKATMLSLVCRAPYNVEISILANLMYSLKIRVMAIADCYIGKFILFLN